VWVIAAFYVGLLIKGAVAHHLLRRARKI